ncbi:recombinase zinc beta ribbon domain-containing protein [Pelobacter propionicus]|uniref:Recombinase n=1 Tax=Pelobacter propionicus (strain DSM 2379 / NBRC 103807 / OttBd1) TaxID=338966 RepID=A1ATP3_PELPD|nr:recombinase zinc beta ribbon domain-containing protein [Pelobacter propionicus]ABL00714.1 recombinase [Pelobacter propionicus DSM 2379]
MALDKGKLQALRCFKWVEGIVFNRKEYKTGRIKPESEWITVSVEPIIDPELFEQVSLKLESRSPDKIPPRVVSSPTLLTGIVRCGSCGSAMTIATGKGGRYRYYKCSRKINDLARGERCQNTNVPMEKLDGLILRTVAERIFTPERVELMLKELEINLKYARSDQHEQIRQLT